MIWEWERPTWIRRDHRSARRRASQTLPRVLGRMYEGIEYRGYGQEIVEELAKYAGVPVWNGLTNEFHPTQMLADLLTIREKFGSLEGVKFTYMGDAGTTWAILS